MATEVIGSTTLESSPGADANSYISLVDAKAYYNLDPNKDYSGISDETLAKALITATLLIDLQYGSDYVGKLYDDSYALYWPRTNAVDQRGVVITDYTVFPTQLGLAVAEQAYYGATSDREAEVTISNVLSQELDGVGSQTYMNASDQRIASRKPVIVSRAQQLISPFVIGGGSAMVGVMLRG